MRFVTVTGSLGFVIF